MRITANCMGIQLWLKTTIRWSNGKVVVMSSCRPESLRWANCFFFLLSTHVFQTPAVTYSVYRTTYTLLMSYHRPKRKYNIVQQPKRALTQRFQRQKGQKKDQRKQKGMTKKGRQSTDLSCMSKRWLSPSRKETLRTYSKRRSWTKTGILWHQYWLQGHWCGFSGVKQMQKQQENLAKRA